MIGQQFRIYPQGLPQAFPLDADFARLGMESYAGYPLADTRGEPLGLIAAVSRRPIADPGFVESVMKIFAVRAAAVDLVVQVARLADGRRRVVTVAEVLERGDGSIGGRH